MATTVSTVIVAETVAADVSLVDSTLVTVEVE